MASNKYTQLMGFLLDVKRDQECRINPRTRFAKEYPSLKMLFCVYKKMLLCAVYLDFANATKFEIYKEMYEKNN
jgi:hypothetical protein